MKVLSVKISDEDSDFLTIALEGQTVEDWLADLVAKELEGFRMLDESMETLKKQSDRARLEFEARCECDHNPSGVFADLPLSELQKMCTFLECDCKCNIHSEKYLNSSGDA